MQNPDESELFDFDSMTVKNKDSHTGLRNTIIKRASLVRLTTLSPDHHLLPGTFRILFTTTTQLVVPETLPPVRQQAEVDIAG